MWLSSSYDYEPMKERDERQDPDSQENHHDQDTSQEDPFWQYDEEIGDGSFFGSRSAISLKAHVSEERYSKSEGEELAPLATKRGTRIYVMARPYILEPDYRLTVGVYPQPTEQGLGGLGEVAASDWVGMRPRQIGQAQAWLYPQDRTLIIWEAYLPDFCRADDPRADENLHALWDGFESFLLQHLAHPIERIITPSWEPISEEAHEQWQEFLTQRGYAAVGNRAFVKRLDNQER